MCLTQCWWNKDHGFKFQISQLYTSHDHRFHTLNSQIQGISKEDQLNLLYLIHCHFRKNNSKIMGPNISFNTALSYFFCMLTVLKIFGNLLLILKFKNWGSFLLILSFHCLLLIFRICWVERGSLCVDIVFLNNISPILVFNNLSLQLNCTFTCIIMSLSYVFNNFKEIVIDS